ncbi:uncharacterized protein TNCV_5068031 [Trichonephila clavipes]|uniref:Transposase n=1 Tax=Trichonephila clavipes TaxID=2585209 RepID=A0A8X6R8L4_TRICX|nr:uncharacterized protein TNCV_5068031 [Trichonephila clavipes]
MKEMHMDQAVPMFGGGVSPWVDTQTFMSFPVEVLMPTLCYRDDILDAYVHPYAGALGDTFMQEDNARPHRARVMDAYVERETIQLMQWSA